MKLNIKNVLFIILLSTFIYFIYKSICNCKEGLTKEEYNLSRCKCTNEWNDGRCMIPNAGEYGLFSKEQCTDSKTQEECIKGKLVFSSMHAGNKPPRLSEPNVCTWKITNNDLDKKLDDVLDDLNIIEQSLENPSASCPPPSCPSPPPCPSPSCPSCPSPPPCPSCPPPPPPPPPCPSFPPPPPPPPPTPPAPPSPSPSPSPPQVFCDPNASTPQLCPDNGNGQSECPQCGKVRCPCP